MKPAFRLVTILAIGALIGAAIVVQADPATGAAMFQDKGCQECHYTEGPAREQTIDDQLAKKGPELWYAGSKFQQPWLEAWLQDPKPIRPMKYNAVMEENPGDHPALSADESAATTAYLMSLTSSDVEAGVIKAKKNPKGRLIFKKKMPCGGCHQFPDRKKIIGGRSGPSLVGAGERLNPDWIYAYLMQPEVFKPVKMMPVFTGILSEKDMKSVSAHIASFK